MRGMKEERARGPVTHAATRPWTAVKSRSHGGGRGIGGLARGAGRGSATTERRKKERILARSFLGLTSRDCSARQRRFFGRLGRPFRRGAAGYPRQVSSRRRMR